MEDRMQRALARWPNVPALYGWLSLDRRGRWRIQGEIITRAQIIDTISANYLADEHGAWYFQNGPQRGYVQLEAAPLILRADSEDLCTHTGAAVTTPSSTWLDEHGNLLMATEHGPAQLDDTEAEWLSPELLIRRLAVAKRVAEKTVILPSLEKSIVNNFDNAADVMDYMNTCKGGGSAEYSAARTDGVYLFPCEWMLKV